MVISKNNFSFVQLDEEATRRRDQPSFHWFAEGQHSDCRGQVYNLDENGELNLPRDWVRHVFIVVGIHGEVDAYLEERVRSRSRLVVLPGTPCRLHARSAASIELISFLSMSPR